MADQAEYQRRFDYRKNKINEFYHNLDYLYNQVQRVPLDDQAEQVQLGYIADELRGIENRMDIFIKDLYG